MDYLNDLMSSIQEKEDVIKNGGYNNIPIPLVINGFLGITRKLYMGITAATKVGKTQFTDWILFNILKSSKDLNIKINILYYNLEEAQEVIIKRLTSFLLLDDNIRVGKSQLDCTNSLLDQNIKDKINNKKDFYDYVSKVLKFSQETQPNKIKAEIMDQNWSDDSFNIIIIDHLSWISGSNKRETIEQFSIDLANMRNMFGYTIIAIQQQAFDNAKVAKINRDTAKPSVEYLADCKSVSRDVNIMFGVYNPLQDNLRSYQGYQLEDFGIKKGLGNNIRVISILINREGDMLNEAICLFDGKCCNFVQLPDKYDDTAKKIIENYNLD